jgi:hypothetical protein
MYIKVPSYESVFRGFSVRVELAAPWSGDAVEDAAALIAAIRAGHVYTAFDGLATPVSFVFDASSGERRAIEGDELPLSGTARLSVGANLPPGGVLALLRNGRHVASVSSGGLNLTVHEPGAYRVEAYLPAAPGDPALPWIVSNPIYVGLRLLRPAPPEVPPARASLVLPPGSWHVEKDATSAAELSIEPGRGSPRRQLRFRLGRPVASPFVAMVTRDVEPLRDATRLAFRASASRPMRMSVQVRAIEAARELRWQRSVFVDTTPRQITVFLDDMRPVESPAGARVDRARIESLLFVIDTVHARPGDTGTVCIDALQTQR